jgi:hypothetical protein
MKPFDDGQRQQEVPKRTLMHHDAASICHHCIPADLQASELPGGD